MNSLYSALTKVRPSGEVEVLDGADGVAAHHAELGDVPVGEVRLVQYRHLQGGKKERNVYEVCDIFKGICIKDRELCSYLSVLP